MDLKIAALLFPHLSPFLIVPGWCNSGWLKGGLLHMCGDAPELVNYLSIHRFLTNIIAYLQKINILLFISHIFMVANHSQKESPNGHFPDPPPVSSDYV